MVQGGNSRGKTTLIKSLLKYYTNQNITSFKGTITVWNSKNQHLTLIECPNDICFGWIFLIGLVEVI